MPSISNGSCNRNDQMSQGCTAQCSVTSTEDILNVYCIISGGGYSNASMLNNQDGVWKSACALPPMGVNPPYSYVFQVDYKASVQGAGGTVGGF